MSVWTYLAGISLLSRTGSKNEWLKLWGNRTAILREAKPEKLNMAEVTSPEKGKHYGQHIGSGPMVAAKGPDGWISLVHYYGWWVSKRPKASKSGKMPVMSLVKSSSWWSWPGTERQVYRQTWPSFLDRLTNGPCQSMDDTLILEKFKSVWGPGETPHWKTLNGSKSP